MADIGRILGLSIEESAVRAVELLRKDGKTIVLAADTWANTLPPPGETMSDENVGAFKDALDAFLKVNRVKAQHVSIALDTSGLFITTIPLPETSTREDIHHQIVWELQQFFPDVAPTDFVHDAHRLAVDHQHGVAEFLCVAARRQYARTVQSILDDRGFHLELVDADHFAVEHALRAGYPEALQKETLLAGVKKDRIDLSVLRNGTLAAYDFTTPEGPDSLAAELSRQQELAPGIASIMVYGPALDDDTLAGLRNALTIQVEAMDPFRSTDVSSPARLSPGLHLPPHWYCAAVGVALRSE
jgi:Tfp pilus assembly PilM family ATPase